MSDTDLMVRVEALETALGNLAEATGKLAGESIVNNHGLLWLGSVLVSAKVLPPEMLATILEVIEENLDPETQELAARALGNLRLWLNARA